MLLAGEDVGDRAVVDHLELGVAPVDLEAHAVVAERRRRARRSSRPSGSGARGAGRSCTSCMPPTSAPRDISRAGGHPGTRRCRARSRRGPRVCWLPRMLDWAIGERRGGRRQVGDLAGEDDGRLQASVGPGFTWYGATAGVRRGATGRRDGSPSPGPALGSDGCALDTCRSCAGVRTWWVAEVATIRSAGPWVATPRTTATTVSTPTSDEGAEPPGQTARQRRSSRGARTARRGAWPCRALPSAGDRGGSVAGSAAASESKRASRGAGSYRQPRRGGGSVARCEHRPDGVRQARPRVRRPAGRPAHLRPPGRPGGEGARPRGRDPLRDQPAPGARPGRRGARAAPDLRPDDPGHQHRQRAGLHHRAAQHAPLRAASDRDPRDRADARPHGHHRAHRRPRHGLRRRHGAGAHPRLGAQPGRRAGAGQGPAPAWPDLRRGVARRGGPGRAAAHPGRRPT